MGGERPRLAAEVLQVHGTVVESRWFDTKPAARKWFREDYEHKKPQMYNDPGLEAKISDALSRRNDVGYFAKWLERHNYE